MLDTRVHTRLVCSIGERYFGCLRAMERKSARFLLVEWLTYAVGVAELLCKRSLAQHTFDLQGIPARVVISPAP